MLFSYLLNATAFQLRRYARNFRYKLLPTAKPEQAIDYELILRLIGERK
jgi:hypothetical protein